jgi:uncharacterized paraquat-inducible protein A
MDELTVTNTRISVPKNRDAMVMVKCKRCDVFFDKLYEDSTQEYCLRCSRTLQADFEAGYTDE